MTFYIVLDFSLIYLHPIISWQICHCLSLQNFLHESVGISATASILLLKPCADALLIKYKNMITIEGISDLHRQVHSIQFIHSRVHTVPFNILHSCQIYKCWSRVSLRLPIYVLQNTYDSCSETTASLEYGIEQTYTYSSSIILCNVCAR